MKKKNRISLFKRFKMAVFELENYIIFLNEKKFTAIGFCFKATVVFSLILAFSYLGFIYAKYSSPGKYLDKILPNFVYQDRKMTIEENKDDSKDKKNVARAMKKLNLTYVEIFQNETFEKTDLIDFVNKNEQKVSVAIFCAILIESIWNLFTFWIMLGFLTSFVGWIILGFSRIRMKYAKLYSLSLYSSTLTIFLTVLYSLLNTIFGIYIEIFDYLAMLIAYIYITAVIYMIKSDLIRQQVELMKIIKVQNNTDQSNETEEKPTKQKDEENNDGNQVEPEADVEVGKEENPDSSEIIRRID